MQRRQGSIPVGCVPPTFLVLVGVVCPTPLNANPSEGKPLLDADPPPPRLVM